jgi:hypothetical protein
MAEGYDDQFMTKAFVKVRHTGQSLAQFLIKK